MVTNDILYEMARQKIGDQLQQSVERRRTDEMGLIPAMGFTLGLRRLIGHIVIGFGEWIRGASIDSTSGMNRAG